MHDNPLLTQYAVEHTTMQVYWADEHGNFLEANPAACRALGYTRDELLKLSIADIDRSHYLPDGWKPFMNHLDEEKKAVIETVHRRKDGSTFDAQVTISIFERDGQTVICGLAEDISERKRLERDLIKSNETFRAAINTTDLGYWGVNLDGFIIDVNAAYAQFSGYSRQELIGMHITDLDALEDETITSKRIEHVMSDGYERFRSIHLRKDGSRWPVEVVTSYSPLDGGRFFVFLEDITAKVETERREKEYRTRLENSKANLNNAQRIARLGNWSFNLLSDHLTWSEEVFEVLGMNPDDVAPSYGNFIRAVHEDDRDFVDRTFRDSLKTRQPFQLEHRIRRPRDGIVRWVHERCEYTVDESGKVLRSDGTVQDISDRKRMENALIEAKQDAERANHAKSEFLANMSHDLRTPLNAIIGFSEMMCQEMFGALPKQYKEYSELIEKSGKSLLKSVNSILDLSKIEAGKFELEIQETRVGDLVDEAISLLDVLAEEKGIHLVNRTHNTHALTLDPVRIGQVLVNVIGNAIKFTENGSVTVSNRSDATVHRIIVTDTGAGMTDDQIAVALQPFGQVHGTAMTRSQPGTGLGLTLSQKVMELHGGSLEISSTPGVGTRVELTFPDHNHRDHS